MHLFIGPDTATTREQGRWPRTISQKHVNKQQQPEAGSVPGKSPARSKFVGISRQNWGPRTAKREKHASGRPREEVCRSLHSECFRLRHVGIDLSFGKAKVCIKSASHSTPFQSATCQHDACGWRVLTCSSCLGTRLPATMYSHIQDCISGSICTLFRNFAT